MKILIWSGYQSSKWNLSTWLENGVGGSEYCILQLAIALNKLKHNVTVSGEVENEEFDGIQFIHYNNFLNYQGPVGLSDKNYLKVFSHYNVIIGSNYIHYAKHLESYKITFDRSYFWLHNEYFYKWYNGDEMEDWEKYLFSPKLNKIIGVSKFHEKILKDNSNSLFNYDNTKSSKLICSIDNAIDIDGYSNSLNNKIKGRIIWSSSPYRGLQLILDNWKKWKEKRSDLSLVICSPPYSEDWFQTDISELKDVQWLGSLSPKELREQQSKSEYWIYVSDYLETYCLTALEMMLQKVKIITNGAGNIKNLIDDGERGIMVDEINPDLILEYLVGDIKSKLLSYRWGEMVEKAYEWAKEQSWDNRVKEWVKLIQE
tara:strand:+ start:2003 stop:3118 length:1116 start_codon:yes stop_codon:yes gene_type:complete